MSKKHTTIKAIKNRYSKVFRIGYCDLQYIMKYEEPIYYNSGVYGWNCDIYIDFERDIAITTGYRNMCGNRIPSDILDKYNARAKEILKDTFSVSYEEIEEKLTANKEAFFEELDNL